MNKDSIEKSYQAAKEQYAELGVNTDAAMKKLGEIPLSVHCWQGDDVGGFEQPEAALSGSGLAVTGNYPGKARTIGELKADLETMYSFLPGSHRLSLHAIYGDFGRKTVDRDAIEPEHFRTWTEWAKKNRVKLDFNCTCFSHPKAQTGFSLSSKDPGIRKFWIEHVKRTREISAYFGRELKSPCIHNIWLADGIKDLPADRYGYRSILKDSLDELFAVKYDPMEMKDSLECKLFGIGSEAYVVGSHEFYLGYAISKGKMLCFDMGHFHPTELVADKISAVLLFTDELLLHISRGVRWDSDHVPILNDELHLLCEEVVRSGKLEQVHFGTDFFDATINRIGAWAIGTRAVQKALLFALLEPSIELKQYEEAGDGFARLALIERFKLMPLGAVWDYFCVCMGAPTDAELIDRVHAYEKNVLGKRM